MPLIQKPTDPQQSHSGYLPPAAEVIAKVNPLLTECFHASRDKIKPSTLYAAIDALQATMATGLPHRIALEHNTVLTFQAQHSFLGTQIYFESNPRIPAQKKGYFDITAPDELKVFCETLYAFLVRNEYPPSCLESLRTAFQWGYHRIANRITAPTPN